MPITVAGTTITFNDSTTQSTAGQPNPTSLSQVGAVGAFWCSLSSAVSLDGTADGAYLFRTTGSGQAVGTRFDMSGGNWVNRTTSFTGSGMTWVPFGSGTWRLIGTGTHGGTFYNSGYISTDNGSIMLWMRIA